MMCCEVGGSPKISSIGTLLLILKAFTFILLCSSNQTEDMLLNLTEISGTAIQVDLTVLIQPKNNTQYTIQIKYQPQSLSRAPDKKECVSHPYKYKPPNVQELCNSTIEWFGYYNAPVGSRDLFLEQLCAPKIDSLPFANVVNHTITGLQSNIIYIIRASVFDKSSGTELEFREDCGTTKSGPPLYPPQTDLSSFQIQDISSPKPYVNLFWRPLPGLLIGHLYTKYKVGCYKTFAPSNTSTTSYEKDGLDRMNGSAKFQLDLNYSHNCIIQAHNNYGSAPFDSTIYIPSKSHIYNDSLELQVSQLTNNKYILLWINIEETLSSVYPKLNLTGGYYTLYWCQPEPGDKECSKIEGMKKTRQNSEEVMIKKPDAGTKLFGVSYTVPDQNYSTGISWANDCLTKTNKYCDITSIRSDLTGTKLIIYWREKCDPIKALMVGFDIEVCHTGLVYNECIDGVESSFRNYTDPQNSISSCHTTHVARNISLTEVTISNLLPNHEYSVRMRARLKNETDPLPSNFTDKKNVSTVDPNCQFSPRSIFQRFVVYPTSTIITLCLVGWLYQQCTRYRKATKNLTKVLDKILDDAVISNDSSDFKYLFNRSSNHAQNTIISNPTSSASIQSSGESSTAICVSDYITMKHTDTDQLIEMNDDKRTSIANDYSDTWQTVLHNHQNSLSDGQGSESTSHFCKDLVDSDHDDELSLDSHSSFIQHILQPDSLEFS